MTSDLRGRTGRVVVVAGPGGAPGRSAIAANLAALSARSGKKVLLLDLDLESPTLRFSFGVSSAASGLAAAMRLLGQNRLEEEQLVRIAQLNAVRPHGLSLVTGLARDSLIEEVTPHRVANLLELAKGCFDAVVVDTPPLPSTAQLALESHAAKTDILVAAMEAAEVAVLVGEPSLAGVSRLIEAASVVRGMAAERVVTVLNRARPGLHSVREVELATADLAGFAIDVAIEDDRFAFDLAQMEGRPAVLRRRRSAATAGLRQLLASVMDTGDG